MSACNWYMLQEASPFAVHDNIDGHDLQWSTPPCHHQLPLDQTDHLDYPNYSELSNLTSIWDNTSSSLNHEYDVQQHVSHHHHQHQAAAANKVVITTTMEKKRKSTIPPKETRKAKVKKQRKWRNEMILEDDEKERGSELEEEEGDQGYVYVRARRGQATDSHSLAERVRRQKISERMKLLQSLVPGCDKIAGKALILEEIINYVHSLQNQVQSLMAKLAFIDPTFSPFTSLDHQLHFIPPTTQSQENSSSTSVEEGSLMMAYPVVENTSAVVIQGSCYSETSSDQSTSIWFPPLLEHQQYTL